MVSGALPFRPLLAEGGVVNTGGWRIQAHRRRGPFKPVVGLSGGLSPLQPLLPPLHHKAVSHHKRALRIQPIHSRFQCALHALKLHVIRGPGSRASPCSQHFWDFQALPFVLRSCRVGHRQTGTAINALHIKRSGKEAAAESLICARGEVVPLPLQSGRLPARMQIQSKVAAHTRLRADIIPRIQSTSLRIGTAKGAPSLSPLLA